MPVLAKKDAERLTLAAVREAFPSFLAGVSFRPEDTETPDFVGIDSDGHNVGLELTTWLNGQQTSDFARRNKIREQILEALGRQVYEPPTNLSSSVIFPNWADYISKNHYEQLREQFRSLTLQMDGELPARRKQHWEVLLPEERFDFEIQQYDLKSYPVVQRYFSSVWFRELEAVS
jgi:hypothetical protein